MILHPIPYVANQYGSPVAFLRPVPFVANGHGSPILFLRPTEIPGPHSGSDRAGGPHNGDPARQRVNEGGRGVTAQHRLSKVRNGANHPRLARCGKCDYPVDHPIARVCTALGCPIRHDALPHTPADAA